LEIFLNPKQLQLKRYSMTKSIEPRLKLISEYLKLEKSENFVVPEYQRAYSWDISQCDQLWQDIEEFIQQSNDDPYFFGTIIVDCSEPNKLNLIDGQQRTTTFLLLLKAVLLRLNEVIPKIALNDDTESLLEGLKSNRKRIMSILYKAEDEDIPAILKFFSEEKVENSKIIENTKILENNSINELYHDEFSKIIRARNFESAERNTHKFNKKQKDNKYTNYFRNFKFFYDKLSKASETNLNLFAKTFLQKCQIIEIRSWQVEQAITMFNSLNSKGMPLSDADIISAQMYSKLSSNENKRNKFNELWEQIKNKAEELKTKKITDISGVLQQFMYINRAIHKEYLKENSVDVTTPGLRRYYTEIRKELLNEPLDLCEKLKKITDIWLKIKDYPIVKLLLKFNANLKLFLMSYLYRYSPEEIDEKVIESICECLLRLFTLLELDQTNYSNSKYKTFLFDINLKFVDKNHSIEDIKRAFYEHIQENWKQEDVKESLIDYEKNILIFLNEYLFSKEKGLSFDFTENTNVEHIMPMSSINIDVIRKDAKINDKEEFCSLVNKLGNKILLESDTNKSIGSSWFQTKKSKYEKSRFTLAQAIAKYHKDKWEKEDIEAVTEKAVQRIVNFIFTN
jgi:hypothetical protein